MLVETSMSHGRVDSDDCPIRRLHTLNLETTLRFSNLQLAVLDLESFRRQRVHVLPFCFLCFTSP